MGGGRCVGWALSSGEVTSASGNGLPLVEQNLGACRMGSSLLGMSTAGRREGRGQDRGLVMGMGQVAIELLSKLAPKGLHPLCFKNLFFSIFCGKIHKIHKVYHLNHF